jgi:uncharacterized protein
MPFSPKLPKTLSLRPQGLSKSHKITLGGVDLIPDLSGALYVPDYETLIISDLHLEQGTSLARRGIHVPPFDTAVTLALLETVVAASSPKRLVFLGDSFHDSDGETRLVESHGAILRRLTSAYDTIWICGNHDPEPPQGIGGHGADMLMLGPLALRHEPIRHSTSPPHPSRAKKNAVHLPPLGRRRRDIFSSSNLLGAVPEGGWGAFPAANQFEIAGHLHPGCGINQRGRRIYGKCFVSDDTRLIMPAFGAYTGGLSVNSPAFKDLFKMETAQALMIGRAALHRFPLARVSSF